MTKFWRYVASLYLAMSAFDLLAAPTNRKVLVNKQDWLEPFLASKSPYPQPGQYEIPPTDQCRLVHINHLGRHGSRYIVDTDLDELTQTAISFGLVFPAAQPERTFIYTFRKSGLTPQGRKLSELLTGMLEDFAKNPEMTGTLTDRGKSEQYEIGYRLFSRSALKKHDVANAIAAHGIDTISVHAERGRNSRDHLLSGLADWLEQEVSGLNVTENTGLAEAFNGQLNAYKFCHSYLKEKPLVEAIGQTKADSYIQNEPQRNAISNIATRFITGLPFFRQQRLTEMLYELCQLDADNSYNYGFCDLIYPVQDHPVFKEGLKAMNYVSSIHSFYADGPAEQYHDINSNLTIDWLNDFIMTTDAALADPKQPVAHLRFVHNSATLRALQILRWPAAIKTLNPEGGWNIAQLAHMSTNIIWEAYDCSIRNDQSWRVRMFINEELVNFPLAACSGDDGMCDWRLVKDYYLSKYRDISLEGICREL